MSVIRHKKLNLTIEFWVTIEFWNSISIYILLFVCFYFCLITKLSEFMCSGVVSYMQLFDYLPICNITYTEYLNIQKMKIKSLNTLVNITSVWWLFFTTSRKKSTGSDIRKLQYLKLLLLGYFSKQLCLAAFFETKKTYWTKIMLVPPVSAAYCRLVFLCFVGINLRASVILQW